MWNRLKLFCNKMKKTHSSILFRIEAKYSTIYFRITHLKFLWCIKMAWNSSKIENIHWLNAFGYEMYCQFIFTVKMHQSIYKASTHRIMQFSLKIDIIVWSLSLSSIFYQLWNVRKCITSLGIYLKQFHKEKYMAYQNRRIFHASLIITQQAMCVNLFFQVEL